MLAAALSGCDRGSHPAQVSSSAPTFVLSDGTQTVDLARLRGRTVLLNFWATWCAPCVEELPSLMELERRVPQVAVVAISIDEDEGVYRQFLKDHNVRLLTVRDADQRVNALYSSFRYPETYVIDRQGVIRRKFIGAQVWTSPEIVDYLARL